MAAQVHPSWNNRGLNTAAGLVSDYGNEACVAKDVAEGEWRANRIKELRDDYTRMKDQHPKGHWRSVNTLDPDIYEMKSISMRVKMQMQADRLAKLNHEHALEEILSNLFSMEGHGATWKLGKRMDPVEMALKLGLKWLR